MIACARPWLPIFALLSVSGGVGCGDDTGAQNDPSAVAGTQSGGAGGAGGGTAAGSVAVAGANGSAGISGTGAAGTLAAGRSGSAGTAAGSAGQAGTAGALAPAAGSGGGGAGEGGGATAGAAGASQTAGAGGGSGAGMFALSSSVVKDGEMIPKEFRCSMPSPPLSWSAGPTGTLSYAIVFKDVTRPQSIVMHWVIYDIPAAVMALPQGVLSGAMPSTPAGAKQGPNYSRMPVYAGPCGGMNMYKFTLYALDTATLPDVPANANATQIETALEGSHKLATATLNILSSP